MKNQKIVFIRPKKEKGIGQWLINQGISEGFPSPADDFKEIRISLDKELVKNQESTFYARVSGSSMEDAGISDGDLLVIDRSIIPENNKIAICFLDGEFTVKRIVKKDNKLFLKAESRYYKTIEVNTENKLLIWGIVTYVIKSIS